MASQTRLPTLAGVNSVNSVNDSSKDLPHERSHIRSASSPQTTLEALSRLDDGGLARLLNQGDRQLILAIYETLDSRPTFNSTLGARGALQRPKQVANAR